MTGAVTTPGAAVATATEHLPALIDRAASVLAGARTAAEILDARDMANVAYDAAKTAARFAKAKGAHDDLIAAAYRMQADALEIEAGAKRRLADEYDAAQERGEVATHGGGRGNQHLAKVPDGNVATVADLGLSRKAVHEARQMRDAEAAEPGIVRRTLAEKLERGAEPTKAAVRAAVADVNARAEREARQAEHDRQRAEFRATLPEGIQRAEAAKDANRQKARERNAAASNTGDLNAADRIAELEEAKRFLEARVAELEAENKLYGEMKASWEQDGFKAVIAGRDEALRVARERIHSENHDKVEWKRQADYWRGQAMKLGWKSGDLKIDTKTGALRDA